MSKKKLIKKFKKGDQALHSDQTNKYTTDNPTNDQIDTVDTESSFNEDLNTTAINPNGGYQYLNTPFYEALQKESEEYSLPSLGRWSYYDEADSKIVERMEEGYQYLHDWYTNPKRQAIKEKNELEYLTRLRNNLSRRVAYDEERLKDTESVFYKQNKKEYNKRKKKLEEYNRLIEALENNPEEVSIKINTDINKALERVESYPISIYNPNTEKSDVYVNRNVVVSPESENKITKDDKESYKPQIEERIIGEDENGNPITEKKRSQMHAFFTNKKNKNKNRFSFKKDSLLNTPIQEDSVGEEFTHGLEFENLEELSYWLVREYLGENFPYDKYYDSKEEIFGKLGRLRKELNIDPDKEWSLEEIEKLKEEYKGDNPIIKRYPSGLIQILFNRIASADPSNLDIEVPEQLKYTNPTQEVSYAKYGKKLMNKKLVHKLQEGRAIYKYSEIPTKNKLQIIDNFSPNYNYIIEGDKIYYAKKGNDHWVDISNNNTARKNLFNFIGDKYDFRGYEDGEREAWLKSQNKQATKTEEVVKPKEQKIEIVPLKEVIKGQSSYIPYEIFSEIYKPDLTVKESPEVIPEIKEPTKKSVLDYVKTLQGMGSSWFSRHISDQEDELSNLPEPVEIDSKFGIRPGSYTGDTVYLFRKNIPNDRRYILPESLDVNDFQFGYRNRGDLTPLQTEAAPITAFHNFVPYGRENTKFKTFIGISPEGKIKVGDISQFSEGDYLTGTYSNDIYAFKKDNNGKYVFTQSKANKSRNQPVPILWDGEKPYEIPNSQALNILVDRGDSEGRYGNVVGGRFLVKVGDELRLLSGSLQNIEQEFEAMKQRNNQPYGTFYTLDNGSYNIGLRTSDKQLTRDDLLLYDARNSGGGNFLYIKGNAPMQFPSDTILTPNVRTELSESYLKGHPLQNEQSGVLLHHTAFMNPNLTDVVRHLTNPANEVSSHVVIGYDGARKILATPNQVTFHAGPSMWNGRDNVNDFMVGIEFQGDTNVKDLTDAQIQSAVEYLKPIIKQNNIKLEDITTHEQVRNLYNDYVIKENANRKYKERLAVAPPKYDVNQANYEKIINELLKQVYYKK